MSLGVAGRTAPPSLPADSSGCCYGPCRSGEACCEAGCTKRDRKPLHCVALQQAQQQLELQQRLEWLLPPPPSAQRPALPITTPPRGPRIGREADPCTGGVSQCQWCSTQRRRGKGLHRHSKQQQGTTHSSTPRAPGVHTRCPTSPCNCKGTAHVRGVCFASKRVRK